jgi:hypothetical protein
MHLSRTVGRVTVTAAAVGVGEAKAREGMRRVGRRWLVSTVLLATKCPLQVLQGPRTRRVARKGRGERRRRRTVMVAKVAMVVVMVARVMVVLVVVVVLRRRVSRRREVATTVRVARIEPLCECGRWCR